MKILDIDPHTVNCLKRNNHHISNTLIMKVLPHWVPVSQTMTQIVGFHKTMPFIVGIVLILLQLELKDELQLRNC